MKNINIKRSGARFSPKGKYRYTLTRGWKETPAPRLVIIGLNSSKAGKKNNDPTSTRCIRFAYDLGFSSLAMLNAFAYVATKPKNMKKAKNPVGKRNNKIIKRVVRRDYNSGGTIVVAWGNDGTYLNRDKEVLELLKYYDLYCFGITKGGNPKHPLFLRADTKLKIFRSRIK